MQIWRLDGCKNFVGKWKKLIQCAGQLLTSAETVGWEWCDWIWELWQQHVQESSGSVGAGWSDTWAGCDKESCSSQTCSEQWKWRWWRLFWNEGCSEADIYSNSRICRQMRSGQKRWGVHQTWMQGFSRVSGVKWGVTYFGKLFTEIYEQEFSLRGIQC